MTRSTLHAARATDGCAVHRRGQAARVLVGVKTRRVAPTPWGLTVLTPTARAHGPALIGERLELIRLAGDGSLVPTATHIDFRGDAMNIVVKIINDGRQTPGKLADAELHFTGGELDGLKLIGFSIWERRGGNGRSVTFPQRQYAAGGERRTFALLRPIADVSAQATRTRSHTGYLRRLRGQRRDSRTTAVASSGCPSGHPRPLLDGCIRIFGGFPCPVPTKSGRCQPSA